jgi:hypothetical protein
VLKSVTTERFRKAFDLLPEPVQKKTRTAYRKWKLDPDHPSLNFKKVHATKPIYSVRIDLKYRALGVKNRTTIIWFWIGSHAEYNNIINV